MMAEPDGPQREYGRRQAEWTREQITAAMHAGANARICDSLLRTLYYLELLAEDAPHAVLRADARHGIDALAGIWVARAEEQPPGAQELDAALCGELIETSGTDLPPCDFIHPSAARSGSPRSWDDEEPHGGRNPHIGCHLPEGSATWIHGRPHDCPPWARR